MRFLTVLLLALCSPVLAQEHATEIIQSSLIDAPDTVEPGKLIAIRMPPHLPFKIVPEPQNKLSFIDEESGLRAYLILEADPIDPTDPEPDPAKKRRLAGYTITIDYAVVHPTEEELAGAPTVPDPKDAEQVAAFKKYLREHSTDEVYRDEHFVKVGEPKPPDPPGPGPNPPDDLTAKVKEWLSKVDSPRKAAEQQKLAELYLGLASQVAAGGLTSEDALFDAMTKGHAENLGGSARLWFGFIRSLGESVNGVADLKAKGKIFESVGNALKGM